MEPLILEIKTRGLHRYHAIDKSETRVGRALDNDIILSDPTVEPYHLKILCDEQDGIELVNLARVNPTRIGSRPTESAGASQPPVEFSLGRVSARILSARHPVAETKPLASSGRLTQLFGHWGWAALLLVLCFLAGGIEFYLSSHNALEWGELLKYVFRESVLSIAAFVVALTILERLLVNRWEIKPVVISVTLIYLTYKLLSVLSAELMYLFSSDLPDSIFKLGWYLILIPSAVSLYLIRVTHFAPGRAILLATLMASPFAILAITQNPAIVSMLDEFSATANYQKNLSALNWHLSPRVSIDSFIEQAAVLEPGKVSE